MFNPNTLVCTAWANSARLAAISGGGTTEANTVSKAAAAAEACAAVCSACPAVVLTQATYGCTAATIAAEVGPNHDSPASWVTTVSKPCAVEASSAATAFQAEAAAVSDDDPGPE
ncbi:Uncharacterised protein [Mycobacterium tuberculosis]|nr:Uncharacterised protein [Mycobacterium tuberculosis]